MNAPQGSGYNIGFSVSPVRMRLFKPVLVTAFECELAILFFTRSLLLNTLLSHHVQLSGTRQLCVGAALALPLSRQSNMLPVPRRSGRALRDACRTPSLRTRQTPRLPSSRTTAPV